MEDRGYNTYGCTIKLLWQALAINFSTNKYHCILLFDQGAQLLVRYELSFIKKKNKPAVVGIYTRSSNWTYYPSIKMHLAEGPAGFISKPKT